MNIQKKQTVPCVDYKIKLGDGSTEVFYALFTFADT